MIFFPKLRLGIIILTVFIFCGLVVTDFLWLAGALVVTILVFGVPQRYQLLPDELALRSGIIRQRIPYEKIVGVEQIFSSWRPEGGDASVFVRSAGGHVYRLSPRDSDGFLRELMARLPHITKTTDNEST